MSPAFPFFSFVLTYFVAFVPNHAFFERMVNVERIKVGEWQTIDTLISEEALLFAKYLRNERKDWNPRSPLV